MADLKSLPLDELAGLHFALYDLVEVSGNASFQEMVMYLKLRHELESRSFKYLPGDPVYFAVNEELQRRANFHCARRSRLMERKAVLGGKTYIFTPSHK